MPSDTTIWTVGPDGDPVFIPGTYDDGAIVISETTVTATPADREFLSLSPAAD